MACFEHLGYREANAQIRTRQTRIDRVSPVLDQIVLDRFGWTCIASVVYECIELAELLDGDRYRATHIVLNACVTNDRNRSAACRPDPCCGLLHLIGRARRAHDVRALPRETLAHRPSNPP